MRYFGGPRAGQTVKLLPGGEVPVAVNCDREARRSGHQTAGLYRRFESVDGSVSLVWFDLGTRWRTYRRRQQA